MPATVLDSYAVLAYFLGEPAAESVRQIFHTGLDADAFILMTEVNYAEFKYQMLRKQGREVWAQCESEFETLPVLVLPVTRSLSDQAAEYKAAHKMSLADAFAAALAKERDATLVTGDPEFKPLAKEIRIKWLKA